MRQLKVLVSAKVGRYGHEEAIYTVEHARTKVVNIYRRALDQGEYRVLLQLHIVGDLQIEVLVCVQITPPRE
jgi:hypothetical protein